MRMITILMMGLVILGGGGAAQAAELTRVTIADFGHTKFLLRLPVYVAQEEGYFAREGIEAKIVFAGNDDQVFAAVLAGSADYGIGDPMFTAIAHEKGGSAKTVAVIMTSLALEGYTNKPDVPTIDTPEKLAGLRIGSFPAPSTTWTVLENLKTKIPALKTMEIVPGAIGTQLALLEADKVDIALDLEPAVSQAVDRGYRVVFNMSHFVQPQAISGVMTRADTIRDRPDEVRHVVNALQQAITAIYRDPDVAIRTAKTLFPDLKDSVLRRSVAHMLRDAMYPQSVVVTDELWRRSQQTRIDSGDLHAMQPTEAAVDNRFAIRAAAAFGPPAHR